MPSQTPQAPQSQQDPNSPTPFTSVPVAGYPLGIANVPSDTDLPAGSLLDAVNVHFDDAGNVITRPGVSQVDTGNFTGLWSHPSLSWGLCVRDGYLCRVDGALSIVPLQPVTGQSHRFCLHNGTVYWVSESERGMVRDGQAAPWGMPIPPAPRAVAAVGNGGLYAGTYLLTYVFLDASGSESGASLQTDVVVPDNGLIQLLSVPAGTYGVRVYMSGVNGDLLYSVLDIPAGLVMDWVVGANDGQGKLLDTEYLGPPPMGGTAIASYRGRLYVALDDGRGTVTFSHTGTAQREPLLFHQVEGRWQHPETVVMLAPVDDGLFIASEERTWFRSGLDPVAMEGMQLRRVSKWGAVPGSNTFLPLTAFSGEPSPQALIPAWWDSQGNYCVGRLGGVIQQPAHNRFRASAAGGYRSGASVYWRNTFGAQQIEQMVSILIS